MLTSEQIAKLPEKLRAFATQVDEAEHIPGLSGEIIAVPRADVLHLLATIADGRETPRVSAVASEAVQATRLHKYLNIFAGEPRGEWPAHGVVAAQELRLVNLSMDALSNEGHVILAALQQSGAGMAAAEFVRILSEDFPELREIGNELAGIEDCPEVACFNCDPDSEDGRQGCC